ncbi:Polyadenylate-binding (RRM superfamily) protein [Tubulinosema ratisbonensis]|uniref:Polyadenylate-binding (RRM superfamily) protein n=1 Tax=Tubulinosema ratisbonensis TaxID=291195 RepID=A0A437AKM2_9MICR|nr:Polyadenylate-binding (RRM superfamily) protein [Tubulinosema ratisbonensis]
MMINNQILIRTQVKFSSNSKFQKYSVVITFDSPECADNAINDSPITIGDLEIKPTYAKPEMKLRPYISPNKLYVTGFPSTFGMDELQKLLGECKISVPKAKEGEDTKRPYLFVTYNSEKDKDEAVSKLNGKELETNCVLKLLPAVSSSRNDKKPKRRIK